MRFIKLFEQFLAERKNTPRPKGAPKWHDSDAPDAEGRFADLPPDELADWLIKTRNKDLKRISGSLTQMYVFNRKKNPDLAKKMEKTRKEVYKKLGRKDLLDQMEESVVESKKTEPKQGTWYTHKRSGQTWQLNWLDAEDGEAVMVKSGGRPLTKRIKLKNFHRNWEEKVYEAENRIARKKGQPAGSDKHSDLYTDEDPEGTIHGLGFKDAETAEKGIGIIKGIDRTHAHKVQATLVMQQRAKVAKDRTKDKEKKKNLEAAYKIWTNFLEELKKKTKERNAKKEE